MTKIRPATRSTPRIGCGRTLARRRATGILGSILASALVLTACSSDGDSSDESGGTAEILRIALSTFVNEQLDPVMEARSQNAQMLLPLFDTILEIGPGSTIAPGLAETWEPDDDGLTWTFTMRKGVQFHDGYGELTAEDVKFSIERWLNPEGAHGEAAISSAVDRVEVVDPYTFRVVTKGVRADLPYVLAPHQSSAGIVFSKKYLEEKGGTDLAKQVEAMNVKPIGSGPYQFVSRTRGSKVVLEAVEDHWRADPVVKRLEYLLVPELTTQVSMLRSGEADIIETTGDQATDLESDGYEVRNITDALSVAVLFAGTFRPPATGKPTTDVRVRHAMSLAIDRETILQTVLGGYGTLPTTPYNTTEATSDMDLDHFRPLGEEHQAYDPEEAKRLLAEAGYPDGVSGINLDAYNRPGAANLPQLAEIVASQWAEVGIQATIRAQDYGNYRPHWSRAPLDDTYNAGDPTTYSAVSRFDAVGAFQTYFMWEGGNVQLLKDPALDKKIVALQQTLDADERMRLATEIGTTVHESWVSLPLFNADQLYAVNPETVGPWEALPGYPFLGRLLETLK